MKSAGVRLPIFADDPDGRFGAFLAVVERRAQYGRGGRPSELQEDLHCSSRTLYEYIRRGLAENRIVRRARNRRDVVYVPILRSPARRRREWLAAHQAIRNGLTEYERSRRPRALLDPLAHVPMEPLRRRRGRPRLLGVFTDRDGKRHRLSDDDLEHFRTLA